jgi:hypothetical protein
VYAAKKDNAGNWIPDFSVQEYEYVIKWGIGEIDATYGSF